PLPPRSTLFPYTTLFRSLEHRVAQVAGLEEILLPEPARVRDVVLAVLAEVAAVGVVHGGRVVEHSRHVLLVHRDDHRHRVPCREDRKSTRLNSSHVAISY